MKFKNILFFILILCCQSSTNNNLASDSEMVWCLSQETYVQAGSILVGSGWDSTEFTDSGEKFDGNEAAKAKDLYRSLVNSIEFYEFLPGSNAEPMNYKSKLDWGFNSVYKSENDYINALEPFKVEGENKYTSYTSRIFIHWRNIELLGDDDLVNNIEENYINSYSICKLWHDTNN